MVAQRSSAREASSKIGNGLAEACKCGACVDGIGGSRRAVFQPRPFWVRPLCPNSLTVSAHSRLAMSGSFMKHSGSPKSLQVDLTSKLGRLVRQDRLASLVSSSVALAYWIRWNAPGSK